MKPFWKIYFWIYLGATLFSTYYFFLQGSPLGFEAKYLNQTILTIFKYIIICIPAVGIYGLAYKKKIIHHIFWKIFFILYVYGLIVNLVLIEAGGYSVSIFLPFQIITLVGLFIYSYQQNKLFGEKTTK